MTTAADVRAVIGPSAPADDAALTIFISQAEILWNNVSGGDNCGNTDDAVASIKCMLAAHFWVLTYERGGIREQDIGNSRVEFATGSYNVTQLRLTRFGQQALLFDKSGKLGRLEDARGEAVFEVY